MKEETGENSLHCATDKFTFLANASLKNDGLTNRLAEMENELDSNNGRNGPKDDGPHHDLSRPTSLAKLSKEKKRRICTQG